MEAPEEDFSQGIDPVQEYAIELVNSHAFKLIWVSCLYCCIALFWGIYLSNLRMASALNAKKPPQFPAGALLLYARRRPTLPAGDQLVPSALEGLTAVFGMGTGGAPPPLSPGNAIRCDSRRFLTFERDKLSTVNEGRYLYSFCDEASRPISTARLNMLPCLHLQPIKLVVSKWP